uniref:Uncharacterized protein n=1 Tax=Parascaris univalens TaxID=6257 RepID=A0A915A786_PARUN
MKELTVNGVIEGTCPRRTGSYSTLLVTKHFCGSEKGPYHKPEKTSVPEVEIDHIGDLLGNIKSSDFDQLADKPKSSAKYEIRKQDVAANDKF